MANSYIEEQPKSDQWNWNIFSPKWILQMILIAWHYEIRVTDSEMEMHFVAAGVLLMKVMPAYTPLELQLQASSHLAIFKGHWKDVANISLALNELLQCIIM